MGGFPRPGSTRLYHSQRKNAMLPRSRPLRGGRGVGCLFRAARTRTHTRCARLPDSFLHSAYPRGGVPSRVYAWAACGRPSAPPAVRLLGRAGGGIARSVSQTERKGSGGGKAEWRPPERTQHRATETLQRARLPGGQARPLKKPDPRHATTMGRAAARPGVPLFTFRT